MAKIGLGAFRFFFKHLSVSMWTHQTGSHRRKATQDFFSHHPSAVLALISLSRGRFSRYFPSSTVKSNFVYPRHNNRSPLVGHDVREKPSSCDCAKVRTHVPTSEGFELTMNHRGDRELGQSLLKSPQPCSIFRPETNGMWGFYNTKVVVAGCHHDVTR